MTIGCRLSPSFGLDLALEVAAGDEHRARDRALLVLVVLADVEERGLRRAGPRPLGRDLGDAALRRAEQVAVARHMRKSLPGGSDIPKTAPGGRERRARARMRHAAARDRHRRHRDQGRAGGRRQGRARGGAGAPPHAPAGHARGGRRDRRRGGRPLRHRRARRRDLPGGDPGRRRPHRCQRRRVVDRGRRRVGAVGGVRGPPVHRAQRRRRRRGGGDDATARARTARASW